MGTMTVRHVAGRGALAGAVAGGAGAVALYRLVEPSIRAAIAIEEAGSAAAGSAGHTHPADGASGAGHAHGHEADALVSRGEQVAFGMVTVLLVGILIGVAFALVHRMLASRLPGRSVAGSVMALAGLGFVTLTLAPAVVVPANPPAVGDPGTVDLRTTTYLATIACAVALAVLVTGLARAGGMAPGLRAAAATAAGIAGTAVVVWALPDAADAVPADVPADLVWHFRVASLTQLGLMWLVLGAGYAALSPTPATTSAAAARLAHV